ncbi:hypothetical protein MZD04_gp262 [Pseudomonas phage Psa21]|uniref:Uncharacterized protein n=1 Tax=Pseudomonas phage Psa21 TaxID=2530023 RepID=A0A481W515_9CAUD|nr:hypothetical protein MZD04_gp262 [Pseudomonas phage Psa21]QBJ02788.1 hypothetical protein PSA21_262 [Pseudomonas phage Psa21]
MSFVKISLALVVGVIGGVAGGIAIKSIHDLEKDQVAKSHARYQEQEIINLLNARYRSMVEYSLAELTADWARATEDKERLWEHGISAVVYGKCFAELQDSHYSFHVKGVVSRELDKLFEEYKVCKLV